MARRFFFVCAGLLCLALAFQLGAKSAGAQAGGNAVVAATDAQNGGGWLQPVAITATGDVYRADQNAMNWQHVGNVFTGSPTSAEPTTFGAIKAKFRR